MAAASSEPSAQGPARRLGLLYSAIACLVVFVGAAWWSWRYAPLPDPFQPAESQTLWQRLTTPIEQNAFRRLPVISGGLNNVYALKGTDHMWAVGDGGLIVHTADAGESWDQHSNIDWSAAAPNETEPAAQSDAFGLIRSAHAERPASLPPAETAEVQRLLGYLGYDPGPTDGQPGAKTRAAIEQFQRDLSLPVDGKLTEPLRERLREQSGWTSPGFLPADPPTPALRERLQNEAAAREGDQAPLLRDVRLNAVAFADKRLGIAVGDGGVVLRTLDGGARWRRLASRTETRLLSVAFANARRAVAVGDEGTVLVSTDGGEHWQLGKSGTEERLSSVAFAEANRAVAVGTNGGVFISTDGGEHWQSKKSGTENSLFSIAFANARRAVAVGNEGTVLLSTDGGEHWQLKKSDAQEELLSVAFADDQRGAVGVGTDGTVLVSTDGGERWQSKKSGTEGWLKSVVFGAKGKRAVAVGDNGAVLLSENGGGTWLVRAGTTKSDLTSVDFAANGQHGVAVASAGTMFLTEDGGETWAARTTLVGSYLNSVAFADAQRVAAAGSNRIRFKWGALALTKDRGETWSNRKIGMEPLMSVAFADAKRGVAVGTSGTVLLTKNGGDTWSERESGTESGLESVAFADAKRTVVVGFDGTVLLSDDDGETWSARYSGSKLVLSSVAFASVRQGVAVGDEGAVLLTTDGGQTWRATPSDTKALLRSVAIAGPKRAVVAGDQGTILLSTDGGEHWQPRKSGTGADLYSVAFANTERVLAVGDGGTVLVSTDGGESWRSVEYRRYPAPLFLALSGAALLFALLGARRAWREVPVERRTASVTDLFASDRPLRPGERDALDLGAIARGISRFLRNRQTEPPLTIAVTGEWGSGKSSLMGLLYEDLRGRGFRPVWFNAWHHQRGEHLLASLYANIRAQALPPAWTPEGLGFRWDLFWIRARRHWLWLILTVLLVSLVFGYLCFHPDSGRRLIALARRLIDLGPQDSDQWAKIGKTTLLGGGLLAALAPPLVGLYNAVRAFGLEPKRLLGSLAMGGRGALKAEPGVRYRFAAEFADVTKALKPQTLVIFIDDLDRCTQEHVLEVLECINFLVTAGDCYIVLGMSRRWVETCVGLAFKELAAEAPGETGGSNDATAVPVPPGQQASPLPPQADDPRDERRRFARQYLEKLVNIEVPIPRVGDAAAASLLAPPLRADPTRRVRAAGWLRAKATEWGLLLLLVAIAAGAGWVARTLPEIATEETQTPGVSDKPEALPSPEKPSDEGSVVQTPEPLLAEDRVAFSPGARDESAPIYHWGSAGLAPLALLTLIGVLLGRRGQVQTDDSEDFRAALDVMRPCGPGSLSGIPHRVSSSAT